MVRVKVATEAAELKAVMEVRHQVFVVEDRYMVPEDGTTIVDVYDVLPETQIIAAIRDGVVVGGCRTVIDSAAGLPSDLFYDFRSELPDAKLSTGGMLSVLTSARHTARLTKGLLKMMFYSAYARGSTHFVAPVNPKVEPIVESVGMRRIGENFVGGPKGLPSVPMVADLANMSSEMSAFFARQDVHSWLDTFKRSFYDDGEAIVEAGEYGDEAFLVVGGAAQALAPSPDGSPEAVVQAFEWGDVFGELALLLDLPRSSTVRAVGDTDVMVLRREDFVRQVQSNPELAMAMLRSMGIRFRDAILHNKGQG
ncbi:MAG: cyclic nucleotide-binding domain-containing protein [Myxococcota bacterium]